jgi:hypothetical protein
MQPLWTGNNRNQEDRAAIQTTLENNISSDIALSLGLSDAEKPVLDRLVEVLGRIESKLSSGETDVNPQVRHLSILAGGTQTLKFALPDSHVWVLEQVSIFAARGATGTAQFIISNFFPDPVRLDCAAGANANASPNFPVQSARDVTIQVEEISGAATGSWRLLFRFGPGD